MNTIGTFSPPAILPDNIVGQRTGNNRDNIGPEDLELIGRTQERIRARRMRYAFEDELERDPGQGEPRRDDGSASPVNESSSAVEAGADQESDSPTPEVSTAGDLEEPDFGASVEMLPALDPQGTTTRSSSIGDNEIWILGEDAEDFDPRPTRRDLARVDTDGSLADRERAIQVAHILGSRYGWDLSGIRVLADILEVHPSNATRAAVERLLASGVSPEELTLAEQVRGLWAECVGFHAWGVREAGAGYGPRLYQTLGWAAAVDLVRAFRSYPDEDEIRHTLNELLDDWLEGPALQREFPSFQSYLIHCVRSCRHGDLFSLLAERYHDVVERDWDREGELNLRREIATICRGGLLDGIL